MRASCRQHCFPVAPSSYDQTRMDTKYIPHCTLQELYEEYGIWTSTPDDEQKPASYSTFYRLWQETWRHNIGIRQVCQHGKCAQCEVLKKKLKDSATDEETKRLRGQYRIHVEQISADRVVYSRFRSMSEEATAVDSVGKIEDDHSVLSIVADGMDQSKFKLPRNTSASKDLEGLWRPQAHLFGITVHGVAEMFFLTSEDMKKNASATVEQLSVALERTNDILQARNARMPQHIAIQMDNCIRENKNTTMLLWAAVLVCRKVFASISLNFFTVGHTHLDQDQRFTVLATALARAEVIEDLDGVAERIRQFVPTARAREQIIEKMEAFRDWTEYFQALQVMCHGHAGKGSPQCFKIVRRSQLFLPEGMVVDKSHFAKDVEERADDAVVVVKRFMHDTKISQQPVLLLPAIFAERLGEGGPRERVQRNPFSERSAREYRKTATAVEQDPWFLRKAAVYLRDLVDQNSADPACSQPPLKKLSFVFQTGRAADEEHPAMKWKLFAPEEPTGNIVTVESAGPKTQKKAAPAHPPAKASTAPPDPAAPPPTRRVLLKRVRSPPPGLLADGKTLGCSKCRRASNGCGKCRRKAGVEVRDGVWRRLA